ncbi:MAG: FHA domain-containing protein [Phycisphaeraceae bacterium]
MANPPPIEIQLLTGPGAGRQASFTESPVTFGRDADNTLVIAESFASRKHGELRVQDDAWVLANLSPNGTRVNRRNITDKPRRLRDGDVIAVGNTPLFKVVLAPPAPSDAKTTPKGLAQPGKQPLSKRTKLWIGLGAWWLGMIALFLFFILLKPGQTDRSGAPRQLTDHDIATEIRKPLDTQIPNESVTQQRLEEARDLDRSLGTVPGNLFRAYRAYQQAMSYSGQTRFADPMDEIRFQKLQEQLIQKVQQDYRIAWSKFKAGRFNEAETDFDKLTKLYTDPTSTIYKNAMQYQLEARQKKR